MYYFKYLHFFMLLIMVLNCNRERDSITGSYVHLDNAKYHFSIGEGYISSDSVSNPIFILKMKTDKIYGCCNFKIHTKTTFVSNTIEIEILGVLIEGDICLTALGPARTSMFLDLTEGDYYLHIKEGGTLDKFHISIYEDKLEIFKVNSEFCDPIFTLYWRYPKKSFVYLCGTTTETSWVCSDFLDSLQQYIDLSEFYFNDYGEICYPTSSQGHYYDMSAKYFYYEKEEEFDEAGRILEEYVKNHINPNIGIGISLINWKNKRYLSWMMD